MRLGNWLTSEQGKRFLAVFDRGTVRGTRDYAMIALLLGCGPRRAELATVTLGHLQQREEHWVFADMVGKGGHVRTIPVLPWVASGLQSWITASNLHLGTIFRAINKADRIAANGFSPKVIWGVVKDACSKCAMPGVAPHDLRQTCARVCHQAGGELEQIQFLLGDVSVETTERYQLQAAVPERGE